MDGAVKRVALAILMLLVGLIGYSVYGGDEQDQRQEDLFPSAGHAMEPNVDVDGRRDRGPFLRGLAAPSEPASVSATRDLPAVDEDAIGTLPGVDRFTVNGRTFDLPRTSTPTIFCVDGD